MLLKFTFLAFKKSCPNWGEGGGNLDKIQKKSSFFREPFLPPFLTCYFLIFSYCDTSLIVHCLWSSFVSESK